MFFYALVSLLLFQEPLCTSEDLNCVDKIQVDTSKCLKPCAGLIITSFSKSERTKNLDNLQSIFGLYNEYKKITEHPSGYNGKKIRINFCIDNFYLLQYFVILEYGWRNKLRFVRIYFDTPKFDIITKDRAAKFVDYVSAIGGTMGLLTGFSIISGVEILYFAAKIVWKSIKKSNRN